MAFGDYQNEIYFQGLAGVVPSLPMIFAELEAKAEKALPPSVWSYMTTPTAAKPFRPWLPVPRRSSAATARLRPGPGSRSRSDSRRMPCDEHASRPVG